MKTGKLFLIAICLLIFTTGCGKRINLEPKPGELLYAEKTDFLAKYRFFITKVEAEKFQLLTLPADFNAFMDEFWKKRDINPLTPENEFKELVDNRIRDIENEIFLTDFDIPGTSFLNLRSDMAHVYLFYGMPHYKDKLQEGRSHVSLIVWYYFDATGKPLFRFLFYEKYGRTVLFKNHMPIMDWNYLFDPQISPLREISNRAAPSSEDLYNTWSELEYQDPEWAFRGALLEFSYYRDISLDDALRAPEPAALTAIRVKPTIVGQPGDLSAREFIYSPYSSFIPASLIISPQPTNGRPSFSLTFVLSNIDWEVTGNKVETQFDLRMSFQNKVTRDINEFMVRLTVAIPRIIFDNNKNQSLPPLDLDSQKNYVQNEASRTTLRQLIDGLAPGSYVVNIDLRHPSTKKYSGGWREEIVIK